MRTNKHTRETMTKMWIDFFEFARKDTKWGKYFQDGFECCVARPEFFKKGYVQTATQRTQDTTREYARTHGYANEVKLFDEIFETRTYLMGIVDVCCTYHDGGVYVYDKLDMIKNGHLIKGQEDKRRDGYGNEMGKNKYYYVPLAHCYKIIDLWDVTKKCKYKRKYQIARWQYEEMMKKDERGVCMYDSIYTWEDLPDWCLWKYTEPDGTVIEGREEAFENYKNTIKSHASYIPVSTEHKVKDSGDFYGNLSSGNISKPSTISSEENSASVVTFPGLQW